MSKTEPWDYLIVTASNDLQAKAYESQLGRRRRLGLLPAFRNVQVVADPQGKRIGSGGSTLLCVLEVLRREWRRTAPAARTEAAAREILRRRRILIVHAGGDSRRLPAYGPCGKIFVPVPGRARGKPGVVTLFDRILPIFQALPPGAPGAGQIIATSGDAMILSDFSKVRFDRPGLGALGCRVDAAYAGKHGVLCPDGDSTIRLYLQKPSIDAQRAAGALDAEGRSVLDMGVMSFDADTVLALFRAFEIGPRAGGAWDWSPAMATRVLTRGLDLYREICCALGADATEKHYLAAVRASGSTWETPVLKRAFRALRGVPFFAPLVPECRFLHFGTTKQLVTSGRELVDHDTGRAAPDVLLVNSRAPRGAVRADSPVWIEACRLSAPLALGGGNALFGLDVATPLALPAGACVETLAGRARDDRRVVFVRAYGVGDTFKDSLAKGGTYGGIPLTHWMKLAGVKADELWSDDVPRASRSLWNARMFPAVARAEEFRNWLWVFDPAGATPEQKRAFLEADRYSAAEIAWRADQSAFYRRRDLVCGA